jgi:hypothetical protein
MAALVLRVARDERGKLHFVTARYRPEDMRQRCGMVGINLFNEGNTIEQMRAFAQSLLEACDRPIIAMTEYEYEPADDDEDEDDEE